MGFLRRARASASALAGSSDRIGAVAERLGVRRLFAVSSGRAGLAMALRALRKLKPDRDVVAVPAYTCFSVAASVANAGLKLAFVDMGPDGFELRREAVQAAAHERTLALLTANLFGYVNEAGSLEEAARRGGAFLVDDAAQAMGATRAGKAAGSAGDLGIFSLARGKAITTGHGGLVVTNSEAIGEALQEEFERLPKMPRSESCATFWTANIADALLRPALYWVPNSMPFLRLGVTEFDPGFRAAKMPAALQALLAEAMESLDGLNAARRSKAKRIRELMMDNRHFQVANVAPDCEPNYVRLPVFASSRDLRDAAIAQLWTAGYGATQMYPSALCDIPGIAQYVAGELRHQRCAESIAERLLTLPTHAFVREEDIDRMVAILEETAAHA